MGKRVIKRKIIWNPTALHKFIDILNYIKGESPTNAKRVKTRIVNIISSISSNPEMFRADEWKYNNDGSFRVFNYDSIRVSYKIEPNTILIARVSHTSEEPKQY